jgi:flagellar hook capping protein FlgD
MKPREMFRATRGPFLCVALGLLTLAPAAARSASVARSRDLASVSRPAWLWSSIPYDTTGDYESDLGSDHALLQWYNPPGVLRRDLDPLLSEEEGASREQQVLGIHVVAPTGGNGFTPATWAGLTQLVPPGVRDLTACRYVEVWVNDGIADHSRTHGVLHVDLGSVSEDAFWDRWDPPDNKLNTEDRSGDLRLDAGEDTGLDGLIDPDEPGYLHGIVDDPDHDDYAYDPSRPDDYSHVNGTEGNGRIDTEDLDLNGFLDRTNSYFEASIDLATGWLTWGSSLDVVAVDVPRDYPPGTWQPGNGWRLFRIPTDGGAFRACGSPDWSKVGRCRIWLSGLPGPATFQVAAVRAVAAFPPAPGPRAVLRPCYPNPFNPETTIPYELADEGVVRITVHDAQGRLVRELLHAEKSAGQHWVFWPGKDERGRAAPSGVYFCRLEVGGTAVVKRMVLVR